MQYRLKSLALNMNIMNLATAIYGTLTPQISFEGQIGEDHESKEPLYIYVMNRMPGISHLDFILAYNGDVSENSLEFSRCRQNLVADNAKSEKPTRDWLDDADINKKNGSLRRTSSAILTEETES